MSTTCFSSLSGYLYCNNPNKYTVRQNRRSRWYVAALGQDVDVHTPHWHGNVVVCCMLMSFLSFFQAQGPVFKDVVEVVPGSTLTLDMVADDAGTWLYVRSVNFASGSYF